MQQMLLVAQHLPIVGLSLCIILVVVTVGCIRCRKKLTEEEKQQKYFEKFRRSHMCQKATKNRVDIIRNAPQYDNASSISSIETGLAIDHTYETLNGQVPAIMVATPSSSGDHSFFDDSFQTVIEASSCTQTNCTFPSNQSRNQLMPVPSHDATYLTLYPSSSCSHLCNSNCCSGAMNGGFVDSRLSSNVDSFSSASTSSSSNNESSSHSDRWSRDCPSESHSFDNHSDSNEIHPYSQISKNQSTSKHRRENDARTGETCRNQAVCKDDTEIKVIQDTVDSDHCSMLKLTDRDNIMITNLSSSGGDFKQSEKIKDKNLHKLLMEGPTTRCHPKLHNTNDVATDYGKKSASLVLPSLSRCRPKKSTLGSTISGVSDHTYESLTSELYQVYNKRDSICSNHEQADISLEEFNTPLSRKILNLRRLSLEQNQLEAETGKVTSVSDHTYESIKFGSSSDSQSNGTEVVIIGKKISHPFDVMNSSAHHGKTSFEPAGMIDRMALSEVKVRRDVEDRYSPFPSAKKLAIKSSFKQIAASPKFAIVQSVAQNVPNFLSCRPNGSLENLPVDAVNMRTPEIVVENKCFELDATVFISPKRDFIRRLRRKSFGKPNDEFPSVSPMCTYETMKICTNLKNNHGVIDGGKLEDRSTPCRSLPSLPDNLELDLREHFDLSKQTISTPLNPASGLLLCCEQHTGL